MFDNKNLQAIFLAGAAVVSLPSSHWLKIALIRLIIDLCFFVYIVCITVVYFYATVVGVAIALVLIAIVCTHKILVKISQDADVKEQYMVFINYSTLCLLLTSIYFRLRSMRKALSHARVQPVVPQWTKGFELLLLEPSHHLMLRSWDVAGTA